MFAVILHGFCFLHSLKRRRVASSFLICFSTPKQTFPAFFGLRNKLARPALVFGHQTPPPATAHNIRPSLPQGSLQQTDFYQQSLLVAAETNSPAKGCFLPPKQTRPATVCVWPSKQTRRAVEANFPSQRLCFAAEANSPGWSLVCADEQTRPASLFSPAETNSSSWSYGVSLFCPPPRHTLPTLLVYLCHNALVCLLAKQTYSPFAVGSRSDSGAQMQSSQG